MSGLEVSYRSFHFLRELLVEFGIEGLEFLAILAQGSYLCIQVRSFLDLVRGSLADIGRDAIQ